MLLIKAGPVGKAAARRTAGHADEGAARRRRADTVGGPDSVGVAARHADRAAPATRHGRATEIAVLVDDRAERLGQQHKVAWQDWLRLSNLLNLRLQDGSRTDMDAVASEAGPGQVDVVDPKVRGRAGRSPGRPARARPSGRSSRCSSCWPSASCRFRLWVTRRQDGLPLSISWPDHQVAVDLDLTDDDRDELAGLGWTVVPPEAAVRTPSTSRRPVVPQIILGPQQHAPKIDGSVRGKAYAFLAKLAENDALPGLHIEPIVRSVDPRVRTGRVDQFWRAVMFKVQGQGDDAMYVYLGRLAARRSDRVRDAGAAAGQPGQRHRRAAAQRRAGCRAARCRMLPEPAASRGGRGPGAAARRRWGTHAEELVDGLGLTPSSSSWRWR